MVSIEEVTKVAGALGCQEKWMVWMHECTFVHTHRHTHTDLEVGMFLCCKNLRSQVEAAWWSGKIGRQKTTGKQAVPKWIMTGDFGNLLYSHSLLCHTYVQTIYLPNSKSLNLELKSNHILSNPPSYTSVSQVVSHSWPGSVGRKVINYKTDWNWWYQFITQEY